LFVDALRATDKPHARATVAPLFKRPLRSDSDFGMLSEAEIIVRAQIEHRLAIGDADRRALRRHDHAFVLVSAGSADVRELLHKMILEGGIHDDEEIILRGWRQL